jgi:hypothetical protein
MKAIGGFFELEKFRKKIKPFIHKEALALTCGRASINLILRHLSPSKVYIPYYTCNALLEPFSLSNILYEFYPINERLELKNNITIKEHEYIIYINYFGLKSEYVEHLIKKIGQNLIIDNSQAFFEKGNAGIFSFNSARKFFGVPDGSFLYSPYPIKDKFEENKSISTTHLLNRTMGNLDIAYEEFLAFEKKVNCTIMGISSLSRTILNTIDYELVAEKRRKNYLFFEDQLGEYNLIKFKFSPKLTPFCYPFLPENMIEKSPFHKKRLFIPTFWQDVINRENCCSKFEIKLSQNLMPLPVDHRYSEENLRFIVNEIKGILKNS